MKFKLSEEFKRKGLKSGQKTMAIQYGIGAIIIMYVLVTRYNNSGLEIKLPLLLGLLLLPLAWWYFDKTMKNTLASEYEVQEENFVIIVNGKVKKQIPLISSRLSKIQGGHILKSNHGSVFIPDGIENINSLLKELEVKTNC